MKLLTVKQLPKWLGFSTLDQNFAIWQKIAFDKFTDQHKEKPALEAAQEAKKLLPPGIVNSPWFAKVVLTAQAAELDLQFDSYEEVLAALSKYQKGDAQLAAVDQPINPAVIPAITKSFISLGVGIDDIDTTKEYTIKKRDFKDENSTNFQCARLYIKALVQEYGSKQIAYRAIQHDGVFGYKYGAIGLAGRVDFNPPRIETVYSDGSRGYYYFTDESNGLSGYKEITFYPGVVGLEEGESVTLQKNDPQSLEEIKRLGFGTMLNDHRYDVSIRGERGQLNLKDASICDIRIRNDKRIYIEFFCKYTRTVCLDDENEITLTRIKYISRRNRFRN